MDKLQETERGTTKEKGIVGILVISYFLYFRTLCLRRLQMLASVFSLHMLYSLMHKIPVYALVTQRSHL